MRNNTVWILFLTILFLSTSCNKEVEIQENNNDISSLERQKPENMNEMEFRILKFIDKLDLVRDNPNYSGSENWNYSVDSAIWYMEASSNYYYAFPNEQRSKLVCDSVFLDINANSNETVSINEIQTKIDLVLETLTTKFNSLEEEHKFLVWQNYKVISTENLETRVCVYYYFGLLNTQLPDGIWKIKGGDFNQGGICGTNSFLNYDATDKLEQDVFNADPIHQLDVFFIESNISVVNYIAVNTSVSYTPCDVGLLYHQTDWDATNFLTCLNLNLMNIYKGNLINTMNNYHQGTQNSFVLLDIQWAAYQVIPGQMKAERFHHIDQLITGRAYPRIRNEQVLYYQ